MGTRAGGGRGDGDTGRGGRGGTVTIVTSLSCTRSDAAAAGGLVLAPPATRALGLIIHFAFTDPSERSPMFAHQTPAFLPLPPIRRWAWPLTWVRRVSSTACPGRGSPSCTHPGERDAVGCQVPLLAPLHCLSASGIAFQVSSRCGHVVPALPPSLGLQHALPPPNQLSSRCSRRVPVPSTSPRQTFPLRIPLRTAAGTTRP